MSCISPIDISTFNRFTQRKENYTVSCGRCLNCLVVKQSQLTFLANRELIKCYTKGYGASFVTLTYSDDNLPKNDDGFITLKREHLQKFIKNMRRQMEYHNDITPFKYIYCGEYGDGSHSNSKTGVSTCRPHYHIAFIGLTDTQVIKYTRKLWKYGLCDVGCLTSGGIRYICKYMTKACQEKEVKELREMCDVQSPFIYHSIGLGKEWIIENMKNIIDNDFTFLSMGKKVLFPKYVMQFVSHHTGIDYRPYVQKYLSREYRTNIDYKNKSFQQIDFEKSLINYEQKVAVCRQRGIPVTDVIHSKKWLKPVHVIDRSKHELINKLIDSI